MIPFSAAAVFVMRFVVLYSTEVTNTSPRTMNATCLPSGETSEPYAPLDDFVISYFTSGSTSQTLPVTIYSMTRRKISPEINALSTLIFITVVVILIVKNIIESKQAKKNASYKGVRA